MAQINISLKGITDVDISVELRNADNQLSEIAARIAAYKNFYTKAAQTLQQNSPALIEVLREHGLVIEKIDCLSHSGQPRAYQFGESAGPGSLSVDQLMRAGVNLRLSVNKKRTNMIAITDFILRVSDAVRDALGADWYFSMNNYSFVEGKTWEEPRPKTTGLLGSLSFSVKLDAEVLNNLKQYLS